MPARIALQKKERKELKAALKEKVDGNVKLSRVEQGILDETMKEYDTWSTGGFCKVPVGPGVALWLGTG